MDSALIGVVGVIAGSLATGGVQLLLAWRTRHTDAIASARVVYSALADVTASVEGARLAGKWGVGGPQLFQEHAATWQTHRTALARTISAMDFHHIQVAFIDIRHIANTRKKAFDEGLPDEGLTLVLNDRFLDSRLRKLDRARLLAFKAGERWSDKIKRRLPSYRPSELDILTDDA
jgi:hypothetical protein